MSLSKIIKLALFFAALSFVISGCSKDDDKDTEAPSLNIVSPVSGDRITDSLTISVTATDNEGIDRVEFSVQDTLYAIETSVPFLFHMDVSARVDMTTLRSIVALLRP